MTFSDRLGKVGAAAPPLMLSVRSAVLPIVLGLAAPTQGQAAPPPEPAVPQSPRPSDGTRVSIGYLRVEGIDPPALLDAVKLRVPHATWTEFGGTAPTVDDRGLTTVVQVRFDADAGPTATLTIVVSDGRAYDRAIDTTETAGAERARLVAGNIANLIAGIEAGTVAPDRSDVPLPTPKAPPVACPPAPACPTPPADDEPPQTRPPPPEAPRRASLGVVGSLPVALGLAGPAEADRFAAWGGALGLRFVLRGGATFAADLRVSGRSTPGDVRLIRTRVAAGAGYAYRRGRLGLTALGLVTVEPWTVRVGGEAAEFVPGASERRIVVGGAARLSPTLAIGSGSGPASVHLGPFGEVAVSGSPADGFAVPRIVLPSEEASRLRIGGVEAVLGFAVGGWFSLGRR